MSITLQAELREAVGTKRVKQDVRRQKRVPASIYGGKKPQLLISLSAFALDKVSEKPGFHHDTVVIEVDGKHEEVRVQEIQWLRNGIRMAHIDFVRA
jgi:ribosomal protein L25 (general stress protein Ctc)